MAYSTRTISHPDELSPRQREVLRRIAAGASDKEIGRALGISTQTVKNYYTDIYRCLPLPAAVANLRVAAAVWYSRVCPGTAPGDYTTAMREVYRAKEALDRLALALATEEGPG